MDWSPLFDAALIALVVIYLPGLLAARASRLTWLASVIVAPVLTSAIYIILGILFALFNLSLTGAHLFFIAICSTLVLLSVSMAITNMKVRVSQYAPVPRSLLHDSTPYEISFVSLRIPDSIKMCTVLLIYIAVATIISSFIYLNGIGLPDSFSREFDAGFHYTAARSFLDNGIFSIFDVRTYSDINDSGQFYPALWHIITAMVSNISTQDITVSANAVNWVALSLVFPGGIFGLLAWLFKDKFPAVLVGSVFTLAFAGYPWGNLIFGQIISNFYANAQLPETLLLFMIFFESLKMRSNRVVLSVLVLSSLIGLGGTQPNAVFTAGIFFVFLSMHYLIVYISTYSKFKNKVLANAVGCLSIFLIAIFVWALFYINPTIQHMAICNTYEVYDIPNAIAHCALFSFSDRLNAQIILAVICWIGFFAALATKGLRWLCGPFIVSIVIYVVSAFSTDSTICVISGFWYNDIYRTGAMMCIFAMPLAALGMATIAFGVVKLISIFVHNVRILNICNISIAALLALAFVPANYILAIPWSDNEVENNNAFETIQYYFYRWYSLDTDYIFNHEEYDFVKEAEKIIEEDPGMVVNIPYDKSGWLYGTDGLDVMYRTSRKPESSYIDSSLIRHDLDKYSSSKKVREATKNLNIKYVLRLVSNNPKRSGDYRSSNYNPDDWTGINSINDKTPGFEPVLKKGRMRLYKITDAGKEFCAD